MAATLLIGFREALEASLVIGIVLGYLSKTGQPSHLRRWVWMGAGSAVLASAVVAFLFQTIAGGFEGRGEQLFEGVVMFGAASLLSATVLWMQRQAKGTGARIRSEVGRAVSAGAGWGLAGLAFASVVREGVETVLFLGAALVGRGGPGDFWAFLLGVAAAVVLAAAASSSTTRLDTRRFFVVSGLLLVLFGSGLLAQGVHEFQEAGVLPALVEHVWNTGNYLDDGKGLGLVLKSLLGYRSAPSLLEVLAWAVYALWMGRNYLASLKGGTPPKAQ